MHTKNYESKLMSYYFLAFHHISACDILNVTNEYALTLVVGGKCIRYLYIRYIKTVFIERVIILYYYLIILFVGTCFFFLNNYGLFSLCLYILLITY